MTPCREVCLWQFVDYRGDILTVKKQYRKPGRSAHRGKQPAFCTATGTGTFYDKVEAFAHDFTIMVVGIVTLTGSVKSIEASLSSFKSAAQELFSRKKRLTTSEVTRIYKGAKLITSFDDFTEYAKGFLDDDALQYVKEVLGNGKTLIVD